MIDYYYLIVQVYHVIHLIEMYNVVQIHLFHVLIEYIQVEVEIFVVQNHLYVVEKIVPIQKKIQIDTHVPRIFNTYF